MKKCASCGILKPENRFYYLGYIKKKCGNKAFSSYCRECSCNRIHKRKEGKVYRPHLGKRDKDIKEEIFIDDRSIYLLLKRIELNSLKMSYMDSFRLVDEYVKVFGDDIPDYYCEEEQLDIMFHRLKEYIKKPCPYELS